MVGFLRPLKMPQDHIRQILPFRGSLEGPDDEVTAPGIGRDVELGPRCRDQSSMIIELCVRGGRLAPAERGHQLLITLHSHGGEVLALILTLKADCHGVPPCVSRSATRSRATIVPRRTSRRWQV